MTLECMRLAKNCTSVASLDLRYMSMPSLIIKYRLFQVTRPKLVDCFWSSPSRPSVTGPRADVSRRVAVTGRHADMILALLPVEVDDVPSSSSSIPPSP